MKRLIALAAALAFSGVGTACAHHAPPPAVRPSLAGQWVLAKGTDAEHPVSDSAASPAGRPMPRERGGEGGYGGRGGRGERGGGPGYGRGSSYNPEAVQVALAAVARGADRVSIAESGDSIHFRFSDGSYFDLRADGHSQDDIWRNIGRIKSKAEWTEAGLLLERKLDEGVTVSQTFSRPAGSPRLTVLTVVKGPVPRPVELRRAYDPAPRS